ncbi:hypothetical protein ACEPAH_4143 [Sanghuangporus vaninii]
MPEDLPAWRRENTTIKYDLSRGELIWRSRQKRLERRGYLLRPRFRVDWVPSWLHTSKDPLLCEDSLFNPLPSLIDAERMSDGLKVMLKTVDRSSKESRIAVYLSFAEHSNDPRNHCVPIIDVIRDESEPCVEFLVMPLFRPFDEPPFFNVEEVLDFMKQTLEGLTFMHKLGIAHRDCSDKNIMFDAAGMYPKGFHPSYWDLDANGKRARPLRCSDVLGVRYFFTAFGISSNFLEGETRLVTGKAGLDKDVPELSTDDSCDPFPVDIFILGNVFKRNFVAKYTNMQFITPLADIMTQEEPTKRPSASEALEQYMELVSSFSAYYRRQRLKEAGNGKLDSFLHDIRSFGREFILT